MGKKFGFSFSGRRASGLSGFKGRISKKIGTPLTRSGRQRAVGRGFGCCVAAFILLASMVVGGIVLSRVVIYAAEHHIWVDDNGVTHITSTLPQNPVKVIGKETYLKDSPEEIRRYEEEQKLKRDREEYESKGRQLMNDYYQTRQSTPSVKDDYRLEQARKELKAAEQRQEDFADERRNARSQWGHDFWDKRKKYLDRDVEEKRREAMDLQNAR